MNSLFLSFGPESLLLFLLLGSIVGLIAGLFGIGGGLIIVPALIWGLPQVDVNPEHTTHMAVGTSLATIVITSLSSIHAHHKRGGVIWSDFRILTPGLLLGAWMGGVVAGWLNGEVLQRFFGLFALAVGVSMLRSSAGRGGDLCVSKWLKGSVATLIGGVSALVGIGGGSMTVPFLHATGVAMKRAVATSSACGLPIALSGAVSFIVAGWDSQALPAYSSGYVYWPAALVIVLTSSLLAPVGAGLAHRLPGLRLKRIFALFLMLIGAKLLIG
ncbi:MAG: sulfite exporter TauE/SafE family protein [Candidatus Thiodiazotropha sp. (ex Epidulcina cf. delphinae)]|nr:sulfite exporter TauE/SafE family protein [Candidatus Thiodiazotropha sp. (ex Epidulcina cf. delphinae)]